MAELINTKTLDVPVGISLDSKIGIFPVDTDPSVSPGLALPMGSAAFHTAGKIWKKTGTGATDWTELGSGTGGFDPAKTVIVAKTGGDYTSIKAGVDYAATQSPSSTNPWSVLVYSGDYTEEPITVPAYCNVTAVGGLGSAVVTADSTTDTVFTLDDYMSLNGFLIKGASGSGGIGVLAPAGTFQALIQSTVISDCETGVKITGSGTQVIVTDLILARAPGQVLVTGVEVSGGATAALLGGTIQGTAISFITTGIKITGSGTSGTVASFIIAAATTGMLCDDSSKSVLNGDACQSCITGIKVGDSADVQANACGLRDNVTYDIDLDTTATGYYRGSAEFVKLNGLADATGFYLSITQFEAANEGERIQARLQVGSHDRGEESYFGKGGWEVKDAHGLTNTNLEAGTWGDITTEITSPTGSTVALFAGTGVGNAFYYGVEDEVFAALLFNEITTAAVGGSFVVEYWNGSTWVTLNILEIDEEDLTSYANDILRNASEILWNVGLTPNWATKSLNSITAYWIRVRVATALTTVPVVERVAHAISFTELANEGAQLYVGDAQPLRSVSSPVLRELNNFSALDENVIVGPNTQISVKDNQFNNGAKDGAGSFFVIPQGLNTAKPITFRIDFAPMTNNSGNVEFEVYAARLSESLPWDGNAPEKTGSVIYSVPSGQNDDGFQASLDLELPEALPGETYVFSLLRDGSSGNPDDTLVGNIYVANLLIEGTFWR